MVYFYQINVSKKFPFLNLEEKKFKTNTPSLTFDFKLDIFQKMAIQCIELEKNVLVAAHTSSGKTLIAEYAIAKSISRKKRSIYTTPIKALSNQKYKDLCKIFSDVGLLTGDLSINSNGNCMVMTTEVLRCILGNSDERLLDLDWVIIDEAHYIKDLQRGFIWEEILVLLPKTVKIICLSATIPNILEFSEWLVKTRKLNFVSIVAHKRPVPLKEFFCLPKFFGLKLFKVNENNLNLKNQKFVRKKKNEIIFTKNLNFNDDIKNLLIKLHKIKYGPVILFTFSKKKCQEFSQHIYPINFVDSNCKLVIEKFLDKLSTKWAEKKYLNVSFKKYFELLKKGIGIHHASLSPLFREITETLFHANLLFILIATETFSIGLNMPSKTIIFSSLIKFDGKNFRFLNRGEFIQMSGRAGRRGLDSKGIVISILDKIDDKNIIQKVLKGGSEPIGSVFRINTNTFLDFIGQGKMCLKKLVNFSFFEFQKKTNIFKEFRSQNISGRRGRLVILPKFKLSISIFTSLKLVKNILSFKDCFFNNSKIKNQVSELYNSKNYKSRQKPSLSINKKWFQNYSGTISKKKRLLLLKFYLDLKKILKSYSNKKKILKIIFTNFFQFSAQVVVLCNHIVDLKLFSQLLFMDKFSSYLIINYHLKYVRFKRFINYNLSKTLYDSVFSEIPRFLTSFLKIGLVRKNLSLSIKGQICAKISYKENLILTELIYQGFFSNLSFCNTITLLVGMVCEEQYKNIPLHPILFFHYKKFKSITKKLYSFFRGSTLSLQPLKIIRREKNEALNWIWVWSNTFTLKNSPNFSFLDKKGLYKYMEYILNLLEITIIIFQSLGNVFLASRFEGFWLKLKKKIQ
jgi:superfamily II RNA helicase